MRRLSACEALARAALGKLRLIGMLLATAMTSGCFPRDVYFYDGEVFMGEAAAMKGQRRIHSQIMGHVEPLAVPLASHCTILIPPIDVVRERGVMTQLPLETDRVQVLGALVHGEFHLFAAMLEKRFICPSVTVSESDGGHAVHRGATAVIYVYMPEIDSGDWYVAQGSKPRKKLEPNPDMLELRSLLLDLMSQVEDYLSGAEPAAGAGALAGD